MHKARQQRIQLLLIKCTEIKKVPCLGDAFTLWHPPVQLTNIKKKKKKKVDYSGLATLHERVNNKFFVQNL